MSDDKTVDGRHKFRWLTYKGSKVRIDREIVPLLTKMWSLGIGTTNSCQAHCSFNCNHKWKSKKLSDGTTYDSIAPTKHCHNNVWIAFECMADLEQFLNIVAEYIPDNKDSMYRGMQCDRFVAIGGYLGHKRDDWAFSFLLRNHGVEGYFGRPTENGKRLTFPVWIEKGCKKNHFVMEPQITFPRKHLSYVEERLQLALNKKRKNNVA